ncbi:two-component-system connector protein YcgZ [Erwinia sp. S63]|uniref:regulatory protein YcgZ n=1 Tax=Erwinia sp. S63 TaxID=2769341 RepID=UPI00190A1759|nr:regulatory protein YcgZ [Erwinia sp. S63]MBK0098939.1 two-component-system connector protein YcgZ [Erwinia sp. S63]
MRNNTAGNPEAVNSSVARLIMTSTPTQQETLGEIVVEILSAGKTLNRKSLCMSLLARADRASSAEEEQHYQKLIGLLMR